MKKIIKAGGGYVDFFGTVVKTPVEMDDSDVVNALFLFRLLRGSKETAVVSEAGKCKN